MEMYSYKKHVLSLQKAESLYYISNFAARRKGKTETAAEN